ncbi:MAG: response regulator transcription factor [Candidatus Binatia bacterium]
MFAATADKIAPTRVLLVDDEEDFLSLTAELLRREGYVVGCARDGGAALEALEQEPWDVVVADVNMPGNTEMQFVRTCRAHFPGVAVVVVTGYPSVDSAATAVRCAAVDYLIKPVDFAKLRAGIDEAFRKATVVRMAERLHEDTVGLLRRTRALGSALNAPAGETGASAAADPYASLEAELRLRLARLTGREREVLGLVLKGRRVHAIAASLGLSSSTVRNHVKAILRKLGMHSQLELVARLRSLQA